jgi:hypothetical protein
MEGPKWPTHFESFLAVPPLTIYITIEVNTYLNYLRHSIQHPTKITTLKPLDERLVPVCR